MNEIGGFVKMYVYYINDIMDEIKVDDIEKFFNDKPVVFVDDKVFSKEIIRDVEPAYRSIKEFVPDLYDGFTLDLSIKNNLHLEFCNIIKFINEIWSEKTEEDIFNSDDPEGMILNVINQCTIKAIEERLEEIKRDFNQVQNDLMCNKIGW